MLFPAPFARLVHWVPLVGASPSPASYPLVRAVALIVTWVPAALSAVALWSVRHVPIEELLSASWLLGFGSLLALAVASVCGQPGLLAHIDRLYYRDTYEPRRALADVLEGVRDAGAPEELARELQLRLDRWLHVSRVTLLLENAHGGALDDPLGQAASLDSSSTLHGLVSSALQPLCVANHREAALDLLPEEDLRWLVDGGFKLLVPIVSPDGRLTGLLGLAVKRSQAPYSGQDFALLRSCAHSIALVLEARSLHAPRRTVTRRLPREAPPARECPRCRRVYSPTTRRCRVCDSPTVQGFLPSMVAGRLRIEERIGNGGMGIVYRALDLSLDRSVAVKTLTRLQPIEALRLRREARALAAVSHVNLATIYGLLDWRGTPLLVLELLEGGPLTRRLEEGHLSAVEALEIGAQVAQGLESLHRQGILHRDIKPSNIAFAADGTSKLLDFGLARFLGDRRAEPVGARSGGSASSTAGPGGRLHGWSVPTGSNQLVGTLAYLSPEAVDGAPPDPSHDIWALGVVLWEAVAGRPAFDAPQLLEVVEKIRGAHLPPLDRADIPEAVHELFARVLHRDPRRRPGTASELRRLLVTVGQGLAA
jgi:hypothetical protein